jgi:hypothetical protein
MTVNTAAGAKLFIGTANSNRETVLADYQADSYIEVGEVEDLGEFGDESDRITFTALSDARTRKFKGPRDAGEMPIVVGDDPTDEGQTALEAAEGSPLDYNFYVELNDAVTLGGQTSKHYFIGKVFSKRRNVGNASNVVRRNFAIGINSAITSTDPS